MQSKLSTINQGPRVPLVSIVVLTYLSANFIVETLESIKEQTYSEIELIITDDASSDDTVTICEAWLRQNAGRFRNATIVRSEKNTGIAANCNRGVTAAKGVWIKLIAGDDALEADLIEQYMGYAQNHTDAMAITCNVQPYKDNFLPKSALEIESLVGMKFNQAGITSTQQFQMLLRKNCVSAPTAIIKKSVVIQVGGFDERIPFLEDWPMWLAITHAGYKIHFLDIVGVKYRVHSGSINSGMQRVYKTRVDNGIDKMYQIKYKEFLSGWERASRTIIMYRNRYLQKLSSNKRTTWVSFLSKMIGIVPVSILKWYEKRFV